MKIVFIYIDKRGKYIVPSLSKFCEVIALDLSGIKIPFYTKFISAALSLNLNRNSWRNDYFRNPFMFNYIKTLVNDYISKNNMNGVDAVLQFGCMFPIDLILFPNSKFFNYSDGVYDGYWQAPRFGKKFAEMQKKMFDSSILSFTFSNWAKAQLNQIYGIPLNRIIKCGWGPCLQIPPPP